MQYTLRRIWYKRVRLYDKLRLTATAVSITLSPASCALNPMLSLHSRVPLPPFPIRILLLLSQLILHVLLRLHRLLTPANHFINHLSVPRRLHVCLRLRRRFVVLLLPFLLPPPSDLSRSSAYETAARGDPPPVFERQ